MTTVLITTLLVILAGLFVYMGVKRHYASRLEDVSSRLNQADQELDQLRERILNEQRIHEIELEALQDRLDREMASNRQRIADLQASHEAVMSRLTEEYRRSLENQERQGRLSLDELRSAHEKALKEQLESVRNQMKSQTEEILRQREEQLSKNAKETFSQIGGELSRTLVDMKRSFDTHREAHVQAQAALKADFDQAVKTLREQTDTIGNKADHLAQALKGKNKMQGCWGETILQNILEQEGLQPGRDFETEVVLRDSMGVVVQNEDTGKKMRPDFILHYPEQLDVIVDSKVSMVALSDYFEADTEEARQEAAERNLRAMESHVKGLSEKNYAAYIPKGRRTIGYVIMFVPNYAAFQLAKQLKPDLFAWAYQRNVLMATEETIIPFLRMVRTAWFNFEQVRNQELIVKQAQMMVERVADFSKIYNELGERLKKLDELYGSGKEKLYNGRQNILTAANKVVSYGIPVNTAKARLLKPETDTETDTEADTETDTTENA